MAEAGTAQELFTGTKDVAESHLFNEDNLAAWMEANVEGYQGPLTVKQFKGGQSNPTYKLFAGGKTYVMRRKPPGKLLPSAHAVDREFRVINALYPLGFPVARPYGLCLDESVVGTIFYVMDCVEGRILWDGTLPDSDPAERRAIYEAKVKTFADLHNVDWRAAGLEGFGKESDYIARQTHRWTKQYVASETKKIVEMDKLIEWIPANIPAGDKTTIVHGDYRLDNMILHPTEPKVIAVLDWELCTLGDPLADFTYHLMNWVMPSSDPGRSAILNIENLKEYGIPTMDEYVDLYCGYTGRDGLPELNFYFAYNAFRLAAICQGIVGRVRDGTANSANADTMEARVVPLAQFAADCARKAGMEG
ncbi:MAG: phosphotransferase family protein [Henriciella sp.]|jgi:aminoglycoside phosphotransferase (APT) family kinase protein